MDEREYRSHPAMSHSLLREFSKSPAHFRYAADNPTEETEAMLLGTLIHCMALEPAETDSRFVQAVDCDRRTKAGKEAWAELQKKAEGKRLIPPGVWRLAERAVLSLEQDVETAMWLHEARQGQIEKPLFWQRQSIGCKGKPDSVLADGTVVDVKTTSKPLIPHLFVSEIFRRYYHTQAAYYRSGVIANGIRWRSHVLVCVETLPPYAVGVFRIGSEIAGELADAKISEWINTYRRCLERNEWPGYGLTEVEPPRWLVAEAE